MYKFIFKTLRFIIYIYIYFWVYIIISIFLSLISPKFLFLFKGLYILVSIFLFFIFSFSHVTKEHLYITYQTEIGAIPIATNSVIKATSFYDRDNHHLHLKYHNCIIEQKRLKCWSSINILPQFIKSLESDITFTNLKGWIICVIQKRSFEMLE